MPRFDPAELIRAAPSLSVGSVAELRVRLGPGVRMRVLADHTAYDPPRLFTDVMRRGPFARWAHTHRIAPLDGASSMLIDSIDFEPPLAPLGRLALPLVRARLDRMFAYRHAITREDLALNARLGLDWRTPAGRVLVTGAGGTIGRVACALLANAGFEVVRLVRRDARGPDEVSWDPVAGTLDERALDGAAALVHLAGAPILDPRPLHARLTPERFERVRRSRLDGTATLVRAMGRCKAPPRVFVSASATGFYGSHADGTLDEDSHRRDGSIAALCDDWERAALDASSLGVRTCVARFGVVLSASGGAFPPMRRMFACLLGGPIGARDAWVPWVGVDDAASAILHAIATPSLDGPFNVVGPTPATMGQMARAIGRATRRPSWLGVPAWAVRAHLGRRGAEAVLVSQRVRPGRLTDSGFVFRCERVGDAVRREAGTLTLADHSRESSTSVTGPSLTRETSM